ncbi:hypothetical protein GIB67_021403, partial [Kingdonia uniflora]
MKVESEDESDDLIEYDLEVLGEDVVEYDNDPPQKMGDPSVKVTDESRDESQMTKSLAMEALAEGELEKAIEHLTGAILLNPISAIMYGTRASVYIKIKKSNVAIRDANAALEEYLDYAWFFIIHRNASLQTREKSKCLSQSNYYDEILYAYHKGINGVQLYTIVHFGGDIVRPKIRSIVSYVKGSTKLTSLREHFSYEDFVTLLEETSKICREDCKLYNFVHGCACVISSVQDFAVMINMHKTNPGTPFYIWIINELRVPSHNSQNFIYDFCSSGKGLSTTKDTGSGKGLSTTKVGGPLHHNSFPDPEPEYRGHPKTNDKGHAANVPQSKTPFQTIPTNVPLSNEPCIPQSNVHLSNEHVLTNVSPSNEPMLTNVPLSIEPESIIGQTETSAEFWFKSAAYTEDPYDFSKEFNIGDLYRDRVELKNHIRAYAVVNKFNLEHVLSNEYKIM